MKINFKKNLFILFFSSLRESNLKQSENKFNFFLKIFSFLCESNLKKSEAGNKLQHTDMRLSANNKTIYNKYKKNDIRDVGSTAEFADFSEFDLNCICISVFACRTPGNVVFEVLIPQPFQKYITC